MVCSAWSRWTSFFGETPFRLYTYSPLKIHAISCVALFSNEMAKELLAPLSGLFLGAGKFRRERIMLDYPPVLLTMGPQRALILALTSVWVLPPSAVQGKPDDHRRVEGEKR